MDKFNVGINKNNTVVNAPTTDNDNIINLLQNLSPEKLTQLTGLIKLLGS
jgi:hypothetical protein